MESSFRAGQVKKSSCGCTSTGLLGFSICYIWMALRVSLGRVVLIYVTLGVAATNPWLLFHTAVWRWGCRSSLEHIPRLVLYRKIWMLLLLMMTHGSSPK